MQKNLQFSVAPHPEMVHSIPSGSWPVGRQAVFTYWLSVAQTPSVPFSLSKALNIKIINRESTEISQNKIKRQSQIPLNK